MANNNNRAKMKPKMMKLLPYIFGLIVILVVAFLSWNYTEAIKEQNEIERLRIGTEEKIELEQEQVQDGLERELEQNEAVIEEEKDVSINKEQTEKSIEYDYLEIRSRLVDCCDIPEETLAFFQTKKSSAAKQVSENTIWLNSARSAGEQTICVNEWNSLLNSTEYLIKTGQALVDTVDINNAGSREIKERALKYIEDIDSGAEPNVDVVEAFITSSLQRLNGFTSGINEAANVFNEQLIIRDEAKDAVSNCVAGI
ncbi:MAG: hypothetical protein ABH826_04030 [Patescibacteria group bacterium]